MELAEEQTLEDQLQEVLTPEVVEQEVLGLITVTQPHKEEELEDLEL